MGPLRPAAKTPEDLAALATTPLFLDFPAEDYGDAPWPAESQGLPSSRAKGRSAGSLGTGGAAAFAAKLLPSLLLPPAIFTYVVTLISFGWHFRRPTGVWLLAALALVPCGLGLRASAQSRRRTGIDRQWPNLLIGLQIVAFLSASVAGELNYWYFSHPFFFLDSLKTYSNVDPLEMDGVQLMDAGIVHFAEGVRLATDMGMSFTSWDVYCVAPITTSTGLPSQGSILASYDLWAVGMGCCSSSDTNFHCGEYGNMNARAGLRQVGESQRRYYRLAVQQAEAAYNIRARHPLFFYWVQDPEEKEGLFFTTGFENWVLAVCAHSTVNAVVIAAYMMFRRPPRDSRLAV